MHVLKDSKYQSLFLGKVFYDVYETKFYNKNSPINSHLVSELQYV